MRYHEYMLKGGQGDREVSSIEIGSEWVCKTEYPWSAPLEPGDVAVIKDCDMVNVTYWHGGQTWSGTFDSWFDHFKPLPNTTNKQDQVNHPSHYGQGNIECIEYIRDSLTHEEYLGYLQGNLKKYTHRWRYKKGAEDLKKAQVYLTWLIEAEEKGGKG